MRYVAPPRGTVDRDVFERMPLAAWREHAGWLEGAEWPSIEALNAGLPTGAAVRFAAQTPALLADGLHYEQRIAERGVVATRERNWHDLFNALAWLRYPSLKRALNRRQVGEIAHMGTKQRSRPQCALTHFDEAGAVVVLRDPALLALWDAHDWHGLFWRERQAWADGRIEVAVFGHALLEHALTPGRLLVAKALAVQLPAEGGMERALACCARAIAEGCLLGDPQELRPLPLSGIPHWHADNGAEAFYHDALCFRPLRSGRRYPAPLAG
ncbi:DUF3025 domain-containing protein [Frateuria defendens]|uniref:DUF3025 domain-containing protein n=1 Tax=Frateuria defendens TaxID=2219559 RepID=UPI00066FF50B|nr:DUF3025 domain-containing protein [Frateuria defendens]